MGSLSIPVYRCECRHTTMDHGMTAPKACLVCECPAFQQVGEALSDEERKASNP